MLVSSVDKHANPETEFVFKGLLYDIQLYSSPVDDKAVMENGHITGFKQLVLFPDGIYAVVYYQQMLDNTDKNSISIMTVPYKIELHDELPEL